MFSWRNKKNTNVSIIFTWKKKSTLSVAMVSHNLQTWEFQISLCIQTVWSEPLIFTWQKSWYGRIYWQKNNNNKSPKAQKPSDCENLQAYLCLYHLCMCECPLCLPDSAHGLLISEFYLMKEMYHQREEEKLKWTDMDLKISAQKESYYRR